MMNRNERMNQLNKAGVDTSKYFNINLPDGLKPGATISLVINEDGQPVIVRDIVQEQIIADGYVRNTKLHRRFVMAQMFSMLNYKSYDGRESGFHACLRNMYSYQYTLDMMLEEVRVLSKLEARDKESFEERNHFFTRAAVVAILNDYLVKLEAYVEGLPDRNCKGVPYKRIKGVNIFNTDLDKKIYAPVRKDIYCLKNTKSYTEMYKLLAKFMNNIVKLPYNTPKSKVWIDAYKGEGAYYTLKNLVMFHNCVIFGNRYDYKGSDAVSYLENKLGEYAGDGYRMFALMKKVISDNGFDFHQRMTEIYADK